jgi:hypothetical protein
MCSFLFLLSFVFFFVVLFCFFEMPNPIRSLTFLASLFRSIPPVSVHRHGRPAARRAAKKAKKKKKRERKKKRKKKKQKTKTPLTFGFCLRRTRNAHLRQLGGARVGREWRELFCAGGRMWVGGEEADCGS